MESGGRNSCNRGEGWERGRRNSCNRGEGWERGRRNSCNRGEGDSLLRGRAGRGQRGERWILLGVDGQRARILQQNPDSEC